MGLTRVKKKKLDSKLQHLRSGPSMNNRVTKYKDTLINQKNK